MPRPALPPVGPPWPSVLATQLSSNVHQLTRAHTLGACQLAIARRSQLQRSAVAGAGSLQEQGWQLGYVLPSTLPTHTSCH
eukprot:363761-Chlamydomonas_euryale.AAC.10